MPISRGFHIANCYKLATDKANTGTKVYYTNLVLASATMPANEAAIIALGASVLMPLVACTVATPVVANYPSVTTVTPTATPVTATNSGTASCIFVCDASGAIVGVGTSTVVITAGQQYAPQPFVLNSQSAPVTA